MANTTGGGSNTAMAFILGGVVVVLAVIAYVFFAGGMPGADQPDISINVPGVGSVEGSVNAEGGN